MIKIRYTLLIITLLFISISTNAQDTTKVDNNNYSEYEKIKAAKTSFVSEEIIELWDYRNLKIEKAVLRNSTGTVTAKAIRFNANNADGKIKLFQDREYKYLDINEVDSLINALQRFILLKKNKPYTNETTLTYVSRGDIYAGCYMKRNTWRCMITLDPSSIYLSTYFKKDRLEELIEILILSKE